MRHFKKRTVALCLASVITVLGSFSADSFQNNIVGLRVEHGSNGFVSLTAYTEKPYYQYVGAERVDNNMYNITFPNTGSLMNKMPDVTNCDNIESINVVTYPTTPNSMGYTRIYVKTVNNPYVTTRATMMIPDNAANQQMMPPPKKEPEPVKEPAPQQQKSYWDNMGSAASNNVQKLPENQTNYTPTPPPENTYSEPEKKVVKEKEKSVKYNNISSENTNERFAVIFGSIIVLMLVIFIYFMSKDRMASVVGEQSNFDLSDDDNDNKVSNKKPKKKKKLRTTINKLDKKYKNIVSAEKVNIVTGEKIEKPVEQIPDEPQKNTNVTKDIIVDLDTLYNEKAKTQDEEQNPADVQDEHDDLAEILASFSYNEEEKEIDDSDNQDDFNEELYEKTINDNNLRFTNDDKEKLKTLMNNEISDETLDNLAEFVPKQTVEDKEKAELFRLENIIAEYTIKQDLSFSKDDVDTIKKIMNVELDDDFVNDLQTDSKRTEQMIQELENKEKNPHKTSEILTLNVKDLLPDLSKELAKHGKKRIESKAKPEVIYYSEGYEVNKLSVSDELTDIKKAMKSHNKNEFRPSDNLPIVENGYIVDTLSIKDELPDLADVRANPKKYEEKKKVEKIDEKALLESIANVKFKPFYDNVQNELNQFDDFKVVDDNENKLSISDTTTDEEAETVIDLDKSDIAHDNVTDAQELIKIIEEQQNKRQEKLLSTEKTNIKNKPDKNADNIEITESKCQIGDKKYTIIKNVSCNNSFRCFLAHDESGYDVIGINNGEYKLLKHYDTLRTENIQARINEKNEDGSIQYLIRISIHKFIVNVTQNNMEFVMDLC